MASELMSSKWAFGKPVPLRRHGKCLERNVPSGFSCRASSQANSPASLQRKQATKPTSEVKRKQKDYDVSVEAVEMERQIQWNSLFPVNSSGKAPPHLEKTDDGIPGTPVAGKPQPNGERDNAGQKRAPTLRTQFSSTQLELQSSSSPSWTESNLGAAMQQPPLQSIGSVRKLSTSEWEAWALQKIRNKQKQTKALEKLKETTGKHGQTKAGKAAKKSPTEPQTGKKLSLRIPKTMSPEAGPRLSPTGRRGIDNARLQGTVTVNSTLFPLSPSPSSTPSLSPLRVRTARVEGGPGTPVVVRRHAQQRASPWGAAPVLEGGATGVEEAQPGVGDDTRLSLQNGVQLLQSSDRRKTSRSTDASATAAASSSSMSSSRDMRLAETVQNLLRNMPVGPTNITPADRREDNAESASGIGASMAGVGDPKSGSEQVEAMTNRAGVSLDAAKDGVAAQGSESEQWRHTLQSNGWAVIGVEQQESQDWGSEPGIPLRQRWGAGSGAVKSPMFHFQGREGAWLAEGETVAEGMADWEHGGDRQWEDAMWPSRSSRPGARSRPSLLTSTEVSSSSTSSIRALQRRERVRRMLQQEGVQPKDMKRFFEHKRAPVTMGEELLHERLSFFRSDLGLSTSQLSALLALHPRVLCLPVASCLRPKMEFLRGLGLDGEQLSRVIRLAPKILDCSIQTSLTPRIQFLEGEVGIPRADLVMVISRSPQLLTQALKCGLMRRLHFFRNELGISKPDFARMVTRHPQLLHYSLDQGIRPRVKLFCSWGLDKRDVALLLQRCPQVLSLSVENGLVPKFEFLVRHLGGTVRSLVSFPAYLSLSLERRIRPRFLFVQRSCGPDQSDSDGCTDGRPLEKVPLSGPGNVPLTKNVPFPLTWLALKDEHFCARVGEKDVERYHDFLEGLQIS